MLQQAEAASTQLRDNWADLVNSEQKGHNEPQKQLGEAKGDESKLQGDLRESDRNVAVLEANFKDQAERIVRLEQELKGYREKSGDVEKQFRVQLDEVSKKQVEASDRVAVAAQIPPAELKAVNPKLVSLLSSGMIARIPEPSTETIARLIESYAIQRGLVVTPEAVREMATQFHSASPRDVEGAALRLAAIEHLGVKADEFKTMPRTDRISTQITLAQIVDAVCEHADIAISDLKGQARGRRILLARALCAHLARSLTSMSFPEIARGLNRQNYSTVITSVRQIEKLIARGKPWSGVPELSDLGAVERAIRERLVHQSSAAETILGDRIPTPTSNANRLRNAAWPSRSHADSSSQLEWIADLEDAQSLEAVPDDVLLQSISLDSERLIRKVLTCPYFEMPKYCRQSDRHSAHLKA